MAFHLPSESNTTGLRPSEMMIGMHEAGRRARNPAKMQDAANKKMPPTTTTPTPTSSPSPDGPDLLRQSARKVINDGTSSVSWHQMGVELLAASAALPPGGCLGRRRHLSYVRAANWECGGILAIIPGRRATA